MQTHILGYPRIGSKRELKKACENFWTGKINQSELIEAGKKIRLENWKLQQEIGINMIPSNDFSFYDQVLDMTLTVGAVPLRYHQITENPDCTETDLYFAMARGIQKDKLDVTAMEMTKWFDTNYHYIVPEFLKNQEFKLFSDKILNEFVEAKQSGIQTKPVLIGPVSYLLLGKEKEEGFDKLDLIDNLLPVYIQLLKKLEIYGVETIQFDEPFLALDLDEKTRQLYLKTYSKIKKEFPNLTILLATYFEGLKDNLSMALSLPVDILHIDLVRGLEQLDEVLNQIPIHLKLSLGIVDGRNIWKNNFEESLQIIQKSIVKLGDERILIAPSCSLIHSPCDLDLENDENSEFHKIKQWLAFAKQKLNEVVTLKKLALGVSDEHLIKKLEENKRAVENRKNSTLIHNPEVKNRVNSIGENHAKRNNPYRERRKVQTGILQLPLFPTTTIGSFPQTAEVRSWRAKFKNGEITGETYDQLLKEETAKTIRTQEEIGLDVLVHGEFERNDMVEYFGEQLQGFAFSKFGWVQSYGSRCVKPPIIYGDVSRPHPMTVYWAEYAQSLTDKWVKGMLTGPVTILQWSFVRNDQPRIETCNQIALAIRDEVSDLEKAGIRIIQIDEPAIREGLPLRKADWEIYLKWAVNAFKISSSGIQDETQIHTHMCYSEFNDIIKHIANMDADVITIECSRSQMELLDAFADFNYPNEIGPGIYDIHSPRIPTQDEMVELIHKASAVIQPEKIWVNPDCGLKTRAWKETKEALIAMVKASKVAQQNNLESNRVKNHWI